MKIVGCILAAGTSARMGQNKLLMKYGEHTIVEETLRQLLNSEVDEIIIVTGFEHSRVEAVLSKHLFGKTRIIYNDWYRQGRAESIKCAVRQAGEDVDALLFMVADKPEVSSELINRAINRFRESTPTLLHVKTPAGRGHPVIFSRELFGELLLLDGDRVGEELISRHRGEAIELEDSTVQVDIDTAEDYEKVIEEFRPK